MNRNQVFREGYNLAEQLIVALTNSCIATKNLVSGVQDGLKNRNQVFREGHNLAEQLTVALSNACNATKNLVSGFNETLVV
jgi:hypothetical protein